MSTIHIRRSLLAAMALGMVACATKKEPEQEGPPIDIYLLPVGDFSYDFSVGLAKGLSDELKLNVRASLPMGASGLTKLPNGDQVSAQSVIDRAAEVGKRLPKTGAKFVVIALTDFDINEDSQSVRFVFARNDKIQRASVISIARMFATSPQAKGTQQQVALRIYKMVKRAIGEQYFQLPRSSYIFDVMYAPIMSLEDIDSMGTNYSGFSLKKSP